MALAGVPLEAALEEFQAAVSLDPSPEAYAEAADFLLAMRFSEHAQALLDEALAAYPADPRLLEQRAALAAVQGDLELAAAFIAASQDAGLSPTPGSTARRCSSGRPRRPLCGLLDPAEVTSGLPKLTADQQVARLNILRGVLSRRPRPRS